jgi:signal transduction histidine kinase/ActR/RegA family two-component response regulator
VRRWFAQLPIHRKLVVMALEVTTTALVLAMLGLMAIDLWRYRITAKDDTASLARVIAENTSAAVTFKDAEAARNSLSTVRVRPTIQRSCLYLPNGMLFAGFAKSADFTCPASQPSREPWRVVAGAAPVVRNGRVIGTVFVERDLPEIGARIAVAGFTGLGMLLLAGAAAYAVAHRLHRSVSTPITELASAARAIGPESKGELLPQVHAGEDEVGDLVRAFNDMLGRVQYATTRLVESNEQLRRQEADREQLLLREREANRLKDEFLAAVSHELRTPLNAIVGWVQILSTTTANEQTIAKAIASIGRNAKAQTRVIEDLVDVSRIVTGKLNLRFDPVDLREVAESAVDVIRSTAQVKGVTLTVTLPREPCFVSGDRDRLQQIVWNLLSNAVKFTPHGGDASLVLRRLAHGFELEISDTGAGISASFLPNVFDRFRQADGSTTREHGGLGLGLAIVKELSELHGGVVTASSEGANRGATFTVRLPELAGFQPSFSAPIEQTHAESAILSGVVVLAVDDNIDALDVLATSLASSGATVRMAATGDAALREWDREPADVLICDLAMPHMDGFEVLKGIRARDIARGRVTPVIALTAHASDEYQTRTRAAGFDFHVSKPYQIGDLVRTVLAAMERP